jgi:predicted  nucleic acid-binding Zn-ribbon protein
MSQHDAYLARMTTRLGEIEHEIRTLAERATREGENRHDQLVRELEANLGVARERLQSLRRSGAELDEEMTQSFAQSFERLNASVGRARAALGDRPDAA